MVDQALESIDPTLQALERVGRLFPTPASRGSARVRNQA